jgi:hypothetical protein
MTHIHVCLVSEQTIPNILGIYHFKPDKVIFCTTEKMENQRRTDSIINTLKLYGLDYSSSDCHERVLVDQDCLDDCEEKFSKVANRYKSDDIVVNLTGGTKIMVLGAYNVLKGIAKRMIYTPIPRNEFITISPKDDSCKSPISYDLKLTVEAYVTAYGVKVKNRDKLNQLKSNASSNRDICKWMIRNYRAIEDILFEFYKILGNHRDDKEFRLKMNYPFKKEEERELMKRLDMLPKNNKMEKTIPKNMIRFLTGDWLSDYCYNEISDLAVDDCVTGIELVSPEGVDNEFDVMFTKDNALYIVECKSLSSKEEKYQDFLYKISALQQDFGLRVKGFMISTTRDILTQNGDIKPHILKRAKQCSTEVIHPDNIVNIGGFIKSHVKELS